jgi:hypothetical protein
VLSKILPFALHTSSLSVQALPGRSRLSYLLSLTESDSYVATNGQPASLSWNKAPICGLRIDLYYYRTVADLLMWGTLSDEMVGLVFTIAGGLRQRSHSRFRIP